MIVISGIKYQRELESLPYFNKFAAAQLIGKKGGNLDKKIAQLLKKQYLLTLKKGLYVSSVFVERVDKKLYKEYIANILRYPSYISLEYALEEYGLIPEGVYGLTSVTLKTSRIFNNFLGSLIYKNIKEDLFYGFENLDFDGKKIKFATTAKALFDFLYLKKIRKPKQELLKDLRINWGSFEGEDLKEFAGYVKNSGSLKMEKILKIMEGL